MPDVYFSWFAEVKHVDSPVRYINIINQEVV